MKIGEAFKVSMCLSTGVSPPLGLGAKSNHRFKLRSFVLSPFRRFRGRLSISNLAKVFILCLIMFLTVAMESIEAARHVDYMKSTGSVDTNKMSIPRHLTWVPVPPSRPNPCIPVNIPNPGNRPHCNK